MTTVAMRPIVRLASELRPYSPCHHIYYPPKRKYRAPPLKPSTFPMTIAAGLVCSDGIVLAADTEVTYGVSKTQDKKIFLVDGGSRWSTMIAGAGSTDLIKMVVDDLRSTLPVAKDLGALRLKLSERAKHFRDTYIWPSIAQKAGIDLSLELLAAVRMADGTSALFKVNGFHALVSEIEGYEFIGIGQEIARSVASWLFGLGLPMEIGRQLVEQIIRWVKAHSPGCGGQSIIYALPNKGADVRGGVWFDRDNEFFADMNEFLRDVLWGCLNPAASQEEFESDIRRFSEWVRDFRTKNIRQVLEERAKPTSRISPEQQS